MMDVFAQITNKNLRDFDNVYLSGSDKRQQTKLFLDEVSSNEFYLILKIWYFKTSLCIMHFLSLQIKCIPNSSLNILLLSQSYLMILTISAFLYLFSFLQRFENKMFVQIRKLLKCYYLCSKLKVFAIFFTYHMKFFDTKMLFKKKFLHNKMRTRLSITTNMLFSRTVIFDYMINDKQQHQIAKSMILKYVQMLFSQTY